MQGTSPSCPGALGEEQGLGSREFSEIISRASFQCGGAGPLPRFFTAVSRKPRWLCPLKANKGRGPAMPLSSVSWGLSHNWDSAAFPHHSLPQIKPTHGYQPAEGFPLNAVIQGPGSLHSVTPIRFMASDFSVSKEERESGERTPAS